MDTKLTATGMPTNVAAVDLAVGRSPQALRVTPEARALMEEISALRLAVNMLTKELITQRQAKERKRLWFLR